MEKCYSFQNCNENQLLVMYKNGYPIMDCPTCSRRFSVVRNGEKHLSQVYADNYFFDGKSEYTNYLDDKNTLINYGIRYAKIIGKHTKPGKILDIGCAAGFILNGFVSQGWKGQGIEPNATMAAYGRKELKLDIHVGSLEDFKSDEKFDVITMIEVIGHFFDLGKSMENVSNLLTPGGIVLVESWNMKSLVARIFGKNWHAYSPPSTLNWFSDKSLRKLFESYGFTLLDSGYPLKKITMKRALSIIENKAPDFWFKGKAVQLLTRTIGGVVLIYPPVDLKWYVFRKTRGNV